MEKYKLTRNLGDGTYGTVMEAVNISTGEKVAIKQMKQDYSTWDDCMSLKEIKSLRKLSHPNIVKLKEVLKINAQLYMVFEHMDINIYQYYTAARERNQKLPERIIKQIIFQTTQGLAYMHKHGYFHRDLKPENLLITVANGTVKICDFGLAREIRSRPPYTEYVSTRWYRAPELLLKATAYNSPIDIFALGCVMAELYLLNPLWAGTSEIDHLFQIVNTLGTPSSQQWPDANRLATKIGFVFPQGISKVQFAGIFQDASPQAISLLESMLQYDPNKRPTAMQMLNHPYFTGVKDNEIGEINSNITLNNYNEPHVKTNNINDNQDISGQAQLFNYNPADTDIIVPQISDQLANNRKQSQHHQQQEKIPNASQFVRYETEKINNQRNQQKENQINYLLPPDDSLWDYQIPQPNNLKNNNNNRETTLLLPVNNNNNNNLMNNHNPQPNNNHNNAQLNNDMYKHNGGLGVNSIKHPGPPALANWSLSNAQNILNSNSNNINGYYNSNNEYNSNHNPSFNIGNFNNNNNSINRPNNGSSNNNNNYLNNIGNSSDPFISAAPMLLSGNNNHNYNSYKPPIYQSFQPSFNLGSIAKPQIQQYMQDNNPTNIHQGKGGYQRVNYEDLAGFY